MERVDQVVVECLFRRMKAIKDDVSAGRLRGHNLPPEMPEENKNTFALNCVQLLLAQEAKWN